VKAEQPDKEQKPSKRDERRLETMLRLMDKPGAGRIYPDVEAVKASFGRGWLLLVTRRLTASRYLGVGLARSGNAGGRIGVGGGIFWRCSAIRNRRVKPSDSGSGRHCIGQHVFGHYPVSRGGVSQRITWFKLTCGGCGSIPMSRRVGDTLVNHFDGIAAYCDHPIRFGVVESLNTTIKGVLRRARGMRDETILLLKLSVAGRSIHLRFRDPETADV